MKSVALINLGENLSVDLEKLATTLNSVQNTWRFQVVDSRPTIGDPDIDDIWYEANHMFTEVQAHKATQTCDFAVGITHVRLAKQESSDHVDWPSAQGSIGTRVMCSRIGSNTA